LIVKKKKRKEVAGHRSYRWRLKVGQGRTLKPEKVSGEKSKKRKKMQKKGYKKGEHSPRGWGGLHSPTISHDPGTGIDIASAGDSPMKGFTTKEWRKMIETQTKERKEKE